MPRFEIEGEDNGRTRITVEADERWAQADAQTLRGPRPDWWAFEDNPECLYDAAVILGCHYDRTTTLTLTIPGLEVLAITEDGVEVFRASTMRAPS